MAVLKILIFFAVISLVLSIPGDNSCPEVAVWSDCSGCGTHCPGIGAKFCGKVCSGGCVCEEVGHVIGPDNKCIPREKCPK
ncbi:hypothetical protein GDO81_024133 [Engystomops pustulosus]|uniref:TIL domain-containing protein n=1 Tax=Engystomops pustulosus TaxID=76066 RepID=A0AAV6ZNB2_ENGPU|nr:hypothetical protein GDO81_024133 [Engystomops pustulosus]